MELHELNPTFLVDDLGAVRGVGYDQLFIRDFQRIQVLHEFEVVFVIKPLGADPDERLEGWGILSFGVNLGEGPCIVTSREADPFGFSAFVVADAFLGFVTRATRSG